MPKHEPEVVRAREIQRTVAADPHVAAIKIVTDEEFMRALRDYGRALNGGWHYEQGRPRRDAE